MGHGCSRSFDVASDTTTTSHPSDRSPTSSRLGLLVTGEAPTQMAHVDDVASSAIGIPSPAHSGQFTHRDAAPIRLRTTHSESPSVSPSSRQRNSFQQVTLLPFLDGFAEETSPSSHLSSCCPSNCPDPYRHSGAAAAAAVQPQDIPSPSRIAHSEQTPSSQLLPPTTANNRIVGNSTRVPRFPFATNHHININANSAGGVDNNRHSSSSPQSYSRSDSLRQTHSGSDPLSNNFDSFLGSPGLAPSAPNPLASSSQLRTSRNSQHSASIASGGILSVGGARALDAFGADDSISGSIPCGFPPVRAAAALPQVLPVGSISSKDLKTFPVQGILGASNGAMSGTGDGDGGELGSPWVGHNGLHRGIGHGGLFSPSSQQQAAVLQGDSSNGGAGGLKRVTSMLDEETTASRGRGAFGGMEPTEVPHALDDVPDSGRATFSLE